MTDEAHRLTEAELDQIEQRCDAASKPPWQSFIEGRDHHGGDNFIRVGGMDDSEPDMYVSRAADEGLVPASDADLDFIAYARQDLPLLLAEVRRHRAAQLAPENGDSTAPIRILTAPVHHGCVLLRDVESNEAHEDWDSSFSRVSAGDDSVLFAVLPSVDGDVKFEIWQSEPYTPLPLVMHEGSIRLANGWIVLHDPDDDFKIEISGLGQGGPFSILVDDADFPTKVQIVLRF